MAGGGVSHSSVKSLTSSRGITQSLAFAVLEWLLIFLLFISSLISYSVTKFARYCGLETPCLLCSRLDHVLGNEKLGFYWDMICRNHKSEISSMVLCHAHSNLVDVHVLCENCLFSFATTNKSNAETYRLLVGKFGEDSFSDGCDSSTKLCRCCSQPRGRAKRFVQTQLDVVDVPLGAIDHYIEDTLIKTSIEDEPSNEDFHHKNREIDTLPHVGYRELKINSDTESDALFSEDDETGVLISNMIVSVDLAAMEPLISVSLDETRLGQIREIEASAKNFSSSLMHEMEVDAVEDHKDVYEVHGLEDINWKSRNPSSVPQLISFDDFPSSTNDNPSLTQVTLTSENYIAEANGSVPSGSNGILEVKTDTITKTEKSTQENLISSRDFSPEMLNLPSPGDTAYEPTVGRRRRQLSGVLVEQWSGIDSLRVGDDLLGSKDDASIEDSLISGVPPNASQIVKEEEEASVRISSPPLVIVSPYETTSGQIVEEEASAKNTFLLPGRALQENDTSSGQIVEEEEASVIEVDACEGHKGVDEIPAAAAGYGLEEETSLQTSESKPPQLIISSDDFPSSTNEDDLIPTLVKLPSGSYAEEPNGSKGDKPTESTLVSTGSSPKVVLDLGDAYKLAIGSRARQLSGVLAEQWLGKESSRLSEDLRNFLSQLSASQAFERSVSDLSPKVLLEEVNKASLDASNSIGFEIFPKRISLERNESNLSYDGSIVSEIEGESVVERLKRQIEHDRRAMRMLYKELEEERNASSVSANEAMAMITRLQEEKASLHMEALQYLRMMEEQEEYDSEVLQRSNQLLTEKEKEIQELEDELDFYRNNNNGSSLLLKNVGPTLPDIDLGNINDTLLCIEDERLQLQQCLDDLEEKLCLSSIDDNIHSELVKGECSNKASSAEGGIDLAKEVSYLKDKLEGIERDRCFLDRAIKYLRIGDEGLLFIQDIASHLQEMRSNRYQMDQNGRGFELQR